MMQQLELPIASAESEHAARVALIRSRCELIEAILRKQGYDSGHALWKVATYLARVAGWEAWQGTYDRIANDDSVGVHVGTVRRCVAMLRAMGLASAAKLMRPRRGCVGVAIQLDNVLAAKLAREEVSTPQPAKPPELASKSPKLAAKPPELASKSPELATGACETVPQVDWESAAEAVKAAGLERVPVALREARAAGWSPADLIAAAIVVRCNADLKPGALLARIRDGCWPACRVRDIDELKAAADKIRQVVQEDAASRDKRPPEFVIAGVIAKRLRAAQLSALATPCELESLNRLEQRTKVTA